MKVSHVDCSTALKFQWSCIPVNSSSQNDKPNNGSENVSNNIRSSDTFPRSRFHHAACSMGRYVYICGGKDRYSPLRDLWRLDVITQKWDQIEETKARLPHLQGHTMLAYKYRLLIFGGTFSDTNDTPLWIYNTDLNHVHKYCGEPSSLKPVGRREHSAVIYKTSMYIYGGFLDNSGSTDEFWAFSIEEEEWRLIRRHKPGKRHGHVAVVTENRMWLHGGMRGLVALSDLWTFSFGTCTWNKVKGVGISPTLSNHTAHTVENSIILLGGSKGGNPSQDVWIFRTDTLSWRLVSNQNGDVCPPITLHTSILLNAAHVNNSAADLAQSVPQLRTKPIVSTELESVRPWTSPVVQSACVDLDAFGTEVTQGFDILHLDTLSADLDGNNNNSSENIHSVSETRLFEAETSFCSTYCSKNSEVITQGKRQFGNNEIMEANHADLIKCSNHFNQASGQQNNEIIPRIRSASDENYNDAVPLLARFHSVASDVDLGENNLTVTLSDEDIFSSELPDQFSMMQMNNHSLSSDIVNYSKNGSHKNNYREPPCSNFSEIVSGATEKETFDSSSVLKKMNDGKKMLIFNQQQYPVPESGGDTASDDKLKVDRKDSADNSLRTLQIAGIPMDDNFVNSFPRNVIASYGLTKSPHSDFYVDSFHMGRVIEGKKLDSKCVSDLVVEDLESCDISQLFHNIKLSYPPKTYLRSSSLKDLNSYISDFCDHTNLSSGTLRLSKNQLTRSCGNIFCQNSEVCDKQVQSFAGSVKNKGSYKNEPLSGRYIKNVASGAWRHSSYLPKYRGVFNKVADSGKISKATQTTGSQILQQDPTTSLTTKGNTSKFDHFVTHIRSDHDVHKLKAVYSRQTHEVQASMSSIFKDSNMCILVIGGQTESHSFQKEPLKMWLCCLY